MKKRKLCVVTGTRAEYGILYTLLKLIQHDPNFELQLVVTGAHLSPEYGLTYKNIEEDGFVINEKVEMLLSSDTPVGISTSMGLATIGFGRVFDRLKPDLLILLGDRYEMLSVAQAAMVAQIPIAHIAGGDTTEGAFDEAIRHSLTKMSHLHFVTNDDAGRRVKQMGEDPNTVFNVGSMGIDHIKRIQLMSRSALETELDFQFREKNLLVTFHPVTLELNSAAKQFQELLKAFDELGDSFGIIITKPNADPSGRILIKMIDDFVQQRKNVKAYTSLGQLRYLSTIAQVDAVVGNSSSGLYEVPSFKKPTVNIGDRQKGRLQATSVINCDPIKEEIINAINKALSMDCSRTENPYGDGNSSERVLSILKSIPNYQKLLKKHFFEVN